MSPNDDTFDFDAFKQAFISKDVDRWASFYGCDAEWIEYRHTNPPHNPNRMIGQSEIKAFLAELKESDVSLAITDEITAPTRAAFCVTCTLSDGVRRIIEHVIIHFSHGKITRQVDVEAWD